MRYKTPGTEGRVPGGRGAGFEQRVQGMVAAGLMHRWERRRLQVGADGAQVYAAGVQVDTAGARVGAARVRVGVADVQMGASGITCEQEKVLVQEDVRVGRRGVHRLV